MKRWMAACASMLLLTGAHAQQKASIQIDSRVQYQHVTGFGGFSPSPQWSYWLGNTEMDKLFGKADNQLGLNILRIYIANNKNGWSAGVSNAKRAKQYGAFVFASPWSPPASWKSNNSDSNGGNLLEEHYADWAKYLNDYYTYMKQQGVNIDAVSIQNEPDWNATYQSCIWSGTQMAKFLREYGSLIKCKIIAPEAIHFTRSMHEPILNDPEACEQLDILGGHFYGWDGSSYPLAAQKGKEVWMTEYLINERQQNEGKNIDWKTDGFLFARSVNDAMLANMSAWVHYSLKRYYGCLGDGEYGTTNNGITKRGYILSHYAKYVSGTTRVRHSLTDNANHLTSSAYLSVTGDSIIVMVLNPSDQTYETDIELPFNTLGGRQIVTTETKNMTKNLLTWDEEAHTRTMEVVPYSVNTYIFRRSSARDDMPITEESDTLVFTDQFDMSGASCIPAGWKSKQEDGIRSPGSYSLGSRIMSFSPEGLMNYGFYFRSGTTDVGYITYGELKTNRLWLDAGHYTLSYSAVGWKGVRTISTQVMTEKSKRVVSKSLVVKSTISNNGSGVRINQTTDGEIEFDITEPGNHILKWQISKATTGYNEVLVGNIRLVKHAENAEDAIIDIARDPLPLGTLYDLSGRSIKRIEHPGIYIQNGRKILIK